jgi:hypothetical protein
MRGGRTSRDRRGQAAEILADRIDVADDQRGETIGTRCCVMTRDTSSPVTLSTRGTNCAK